MSRMIFVNLPVSDIELSKRFYEAIGAANEPKFTSPQGAMMKFSDSIAVMLLTHDFYRTFTAKPIGDAHTSSQALLCITCDSRDDVDRMVEAAAASGGRGDPGPKQEMGGTGYGRSFEDPDGHHWEPSWMDPAAADQAAAALDTAEA